MSDEDARDAAVRQTLPFLANGTLDGDARVEAEALVARSPEAAAELAFLKELREGVQASAAQGPGELGLARLKRQIEEEKRSSQPSRRDWAGWRPLAAAAVAIIAVQNGWLALAPEPLPTTDVASDFRGGGVPVSETRSSTFLNARFAPSASVGEVGALLSEARAEIVGGPDAEGRYRLRLSIASTDRAAVEAAMRLLRRRIDLVRQLSEEP